MPSVYLKFDSLASVHLMSCHSKDIGFTQYTNCQTQVKQTAQPLIPSSLFTETCKFSLLWLSLIYRPFIPSWPHFSISRLNEQCRHFLMDDDDDDGEGGGSNTPSKERGRSGPKGSRLQRFREWLLEMWCNRAFLRLEHFEGYSFTSLQFCK